MKDKITEEKAIERSFSSAIPTTEFYPELPKVAVNDMMDVEVRMLDATIVENFEGKYGPSTFALVLVESIEDGHQYTTLMGGMVVVKKIRKALDDNLLPLRATLIKPGRYYDLR